MTREEALQRIVDNNFAGEYGFDLQILIDCMAAILNSQFPVEDCISRQAAIKALSNMMDTDGFRDGWAVSRANVDCMLKNLSPVTPKPKTDVLDKIRAEIKEESKFCPFTEGLERALEIIDKHTAESEE